MTMNEVIAIVMHFLYWFAVTIALWYVAEVYLFFFGLLNTYVRYRRLKVRSKRIWLDITNMMDCPNIESPRTYRLTKHFKRNALWV